MRNILIIFLTVTAAYVCQHIVAEFFPNWVQPNFLIIVIIFFNLFRGIRHSLLVAFMGGLMADSFGPHPFGLNLTAYLVCAYATTSLKMYIYETGSAGSRLLMVFVITVLYVMLQYILRMMYVQVGLWSAVQRVLIPQVLSTVIISDYLFRKLKQCALRLFA